MDKIKYKVGFYFDVKIHEHDGGDRTYLAELFRVIETLNKRGLFECVALLEVNTSGSGHLPSMEGFREIRLPVLGEVRNIPWKVSIAEKLCRAFPKLLSRLNRRVQQYHARHYEQSFIDICQAENISLVYYGRQHQCRTSRVPYVINNYDVVHFDLAGFPDLKSSLQMRKRFYERFLQSALMVFCESNASRQDLQNFLQVPDDKIHVVPMLPGGVVYHDPTEDDVNTLYSRYDLVAEKYFVYPAQMWALKNHIALVESFAMFIKQGVFPDWKLVFAGHERENGDYIREQCQMLGIEAQVCFAGYVTEIELNILYRGAAAMVMPTLLGPTNMPILEAIAIGCPVVCSDFDGHREMAKDAAIYIDPLDYEGLAQALYDAGIEGPVRSGLKKAVERLEHRSDFTKAACTDALEVALHRACRRRRCWR